MALLVPQQPRSATDEFDAFISYSTDPDYSLARRVEVFLEGFHRLTTANDVKLKPLQICRDGSDFSLHKIRQRIARNTEQQAAIQQILIGYLERSTYLLVLCSERAAQSEFVNFEVEWFIAHKGADKVLIAVTEGENPIQAPDLYFPKFILEQKLHTDIYYDLRGFKKQAIGWKKVRDYEEELTKLAAHLNNESAGKILPAWRSEETKKLKRQRLFGITAALFFLALTIITFIQRQEAVKNEQLAKENLKKYEVEQFQRNLRNGDIFLDAEEYLLAYKEYKTADSISLEYPSEPAIKTRKVRLDKSLQRCQQKLKAL